MTNEITWTSEDVKLVKKFIDIKNRGYYVSGAELTEAYNRILHKNVGVTHCGSCLRQRVCELEGALNQFERKLQREQDMASENTKESEQTTIKEEKKDNITEQPKKVGRKKKE